MSKQTQPVAAEIKSAFLMWMKGEPFSSLKKKLHRPLMQSFAQLAGATTYKQAKAARDKAVKKGDARKRGAA